MKMKKYIIALAGAALALSSCNDFLEREPLDFGNENSYFRTDGDLEISANEFYNYLPLNEMYWGGLWTEDINSDNQVATSFNTLFYKGDKRTIAIEDKSCQWNFEKLRNINFFINKTESVFEDITGNESLKRQYLGEGYFFRAYEYFRLLRNFGDCPILTEMQNDDRTELAENSRRQPRNEVARFILEDLDRAIELMGDYPTASGRVADGAAYALKSRVALYEGTWEKYHAGTCFVPGNSKWPGAQMHPDFQFKAGSPEAEVNFFLEEAYKAAEKAAALHHLRGNIDDYMAMFNSTEPFANDDEVILARYYNSGVYMHSCSAYLKSGGGCGVTRALVNTYLMKSGLPIYADNDYLGDTESYLEFTDRDLRLTESVRAAGSNIETKMVDGKYVNDTIFYYKPYIHGVSREKATTGYEVKKWLNSDFAQQQQLGCTTSVPLFRVAECYLNYIEAYYLRHGNLGGNCKQYWQALRARAGVDTDYNKTIGATVLNSENDLAIYSKDQLIDPTLYNIRRERRCELIAEGLRLDDLKRWRALDKMEKYQPEGFNLWDKMYEMYNATQLASNLVSSKSVSKYLHPLQISSNSVVYNGYSFPKQHYLEPIPISEFNLNKVDGKCTLYQNPGWPSDKEGTADYNYDCD